jgi:broad-specificity NMP kinase
MDRAIVLTGSPGAGKTSVLEALTGLLSNDGVSYGALESEQLAYGHPWLAEEQAYEILAEVCRMQRGFGRALFLIVGTTETDEHIDGIVSAIGADETVVVCLRADPETAARRVYEREPPEWHGRDGLVEAARRLATEIPALTGVDLVIDTDGRHPRDVAREIRRRIHFLA